MNHRISIILVCKQASLNSGLAEFAFCLGLSCSLLHLFYSHHRLCVLLTLWHWANMHACVLWHSVPPGFTGRYCVYKVCVACRHMLCYSIQFQEKMTAQVIMLGCRRDESPWWSGGLQSHERNETVGLMFQPTCRYVDSLQWANSYWLTLEEAAAPEAPLFLRWCSTEYLGQQDGLQYMTESNHFLCSWLC